MVRTNSFVLGNCSSIDISIDVVQVTWYITSFAKVVEVKHLSDTILKHSYGNACCVVRGWKNPKTRSGKNIYKGAKYIVKQGGVKHG